MKLTQQMYIAPHDGTIYREVEGRDFYLSSDGGRYYPWEAIEVAILNGILVRWNPEIHSSENIPVFNIEERDQWTEAKE